MQWLIVCVCLAALTAVHAAPTSNEAELLKRLVRLLETGKRYHYTKPKTDASHPGQIWVDLQTVEEVKNDCPNCRLYVACKCVSSECHNKAVNYLPQNGYSWADFKTVFVDGGNGAWLQGLEDGMKYDVWDVVKKANGDIYAGYNNDDKEQVTVA